MTRASISLRSLIGAALLFGISPADAQTAAEVEYRLKAVYLLNFLQFIDWPAEAFEGSQAPFILGVVGRDPFGSALDETIHGEFVGGRSIIVKRFQTIGELRSCHALFVSSSEEKNLRALFERLSGSSTLTVSDIEGFENAGGGITFFLDKKKIRFAINTQTMKLAGLQVRSRLLRLAKIINPS